MKKILLCVMIIALLVSVYPVGAQSYTLPGGPSREEAYAVLYDENGIMVSVQNTTVNADGTITTDVPDSYTVRVYIPKTNTIITPTPAPMPTSTPEPAPTAAPKPTLHPAYENGAAAMYAFMVVRDTAVALQNDTQVLLLDVYYQGRETTVVVEDDISVVSAPDACADLESMSPADLKEGDVIYCQASLSGELQAIHLLYRPVPADIVTTEAEFDPLYTVDSKVAGQWPVLAFGGKPAKNNQYAFGVVQGTIDKNTLVLQNREGRAADTLYLEMQPDTIVYVYDANARYPLSMGTIDDILPSVIPSDSTNDAGDVIEWRDEDLHNYALVRLYNGVVTDMIVYNNY